MEAEIAEKKKKRLLHELVFGSITPDASLRPAAGRGCSAARRKRVSVSHPWSLARVRTCPEAARGRRAEPTVG